MVASTDELRTFSEFLAERVRSQISLSPEEALEEWRTLHPDMERFEEDVAAIEEALQDRANGDAGRPFDDVLTELRSEYGVPSKS